MLPGARPGAVPRVEPVDVTVAPETAVTDVAARAVARSAGVRFDPLVCTDAAGRYVGVVGVEDLVLELAVTSGGATAPQEAGGWRMGA